jgi:CHAD domain-containing protein
MGASAVTALGLRCDQTYHEAAHQVLGARTDELFGRAEHVLETDDPERVHKMRVATRRLRVALEVFAECFPRKPFSRVLSEVKTLADALGERRDRDVQIELLGSLSSHAGRSERRAIDRLLAELHLEQAIANDRLALALVHADDAKLERRLRRLAR